MVEEGGGGGWESWREQRDGRQEGRGQGMVGSEGGVCLGL